MVCGCLSLAAEVLPPAFAAERCVCGNRGPCQTQLGLRLQQRTCAQRQKCPPLAWRPCVPVQT